MISQISKTPTWILFFLSIIPIIIETNNPKVWAITIAVIFAFFAFWCYSIIIKLTFNGRVFNIMKFKLILILALLYVVFVCIYYVFTLEMPENLRVIFFAIIPGHIFLAYAYLYLLNFISKVISTLEFEKAVKFNEYISYFICLFFFPIGIWWINPKIKSLIEKGFKNPNNNYKAT